MDVARDSPALVIILVTSRTLRVLDALSFGESVLADCCLAVPTQPNWEVNFQYWQHQMFTTQLARLLK